MKELLSTNDIVLLSFAQDLLRQEGVEFAVFDTNMSIVEGSIGILPRRIMVADDDAAVAERLLAEGMETIGDGDAVGGIDEPCIDEEALTDDLFLGGALKIFQPKNGFRSGIDAILLAGSVPDNPLPAQAKLTNGEEDPRAGDVEQPVRVLEAGCGAGVVALAIAKRCKGVVVDAVEIEQVNAEIAVMNTLRNALDERVKVYLGDICQPVTKLEKLGLQRNSYDYVVANPPFYNEREMRVSDHPLRRRAKRAEDHTLEGWVRFLTAMAAPKGVISMIHRADKLEDVLAALNGRFGGLRVLPLFPKKGEPANRVIVQGVKGSRGPLTLLPGVVLHDEGGHYMPEVKALCQGPRSLPGI